MDLNKLTVVEAAEKLKKKEITSLELTHDCFSEIKKQNPKINAFITLNEQTAIKLAEKSDVRRAKNKTLSQIDGIPIAIKDNFSTKGLKTTAGSKILENYIPAFESMVTQKLLNAGAVILGKTNLDEFGMGSSTENSAFGVTKNPHNPERVAGGSSGGSAAAVAANMSIAAIGTDTGGSIRQPASFCGVFGIKPTYGRVSRYGILAYASSLDQAGPITKTPQDAKIILEIIAGLDPHDSTTIKTNTNSSADGQSQISSLKSHDLTIGVPDEFFSEGLDVKVKEIIEKAINHLLKQGAKISKISLPTLKYALPSYYIIALAEASSDLARYDGIKYGSSKSSAKDLISGYLETRQEGFGTEVKRRIMLGTYTLSAGYYDAYYKKAQQVRTLISKDFAKVFQKVDLIVGPVSPTPAFKIGEKISDPLKMYLSDIYTISANLAGLPAASIPAGFIGKLPVGLQVIAPRLEEERIFQIAKEQNGI
ncbi:MAG TPA: Asp-tRNA(Asn)/Glu-tRNA(Gln) amidotransferase subunit GatA [Patescibacteria group bacterium]|nr:Asp-tRNA(Asn)/Glu-tRNA(Gln) amidotransferase subunit GatA [Patescibacteria group bacterium]